jgi:signal transduction histidine kinase
VGFFVSDTGPGIAPEQLVSVFDRFWQAERGDRKGLGLGLAIARGIVEAHGGRIWAESAPGRGSTFFFTLPVDAD